MQKEKGVALIITFFIMIIILAVVLSVSAILYSEIKIIRNIGNSVIAFYAADSGTEKILYYDRIVVPELGGGEFAIRGLCSMCASENPDACVREDKSQNKSIFCNDCHAYPRDSLGRGCDADRCDNCQIIFYTNFDDGKTYWAEATVFPSEDEKSVNLEIKSKGSFNNVERQIEITSEKIGPSE
ncbi:MAG: hypothetical protein Q8Q48_00825 [Candidatus Staskawiczbacteria bacterium]|nr:hypothetical protein [Candidatus Staskawiczbacteria bacterium]